MKVRKLKNGDAIQVGDKIRLEHALGIRWETVHRVTAKYAFVKYNDIAEGKYRREYNDFGFSPIPRDTWKTTNYSAWRPVDVTDAAHDEGKDGA